MSKIIILGSGIAGLSALYYAKNLGYDATCYSGDTQDSIGGLCSSFTIEGFTFDNAIHLSFANEKEVREIFDKTAYYTHEPISYNYDRKYWLRHPVQNNLYQLPTSEKVDIIDSFVKKHNIENPSNYEEWLISQYGAEFAHRYPIKYTKKYWTIEANKMGVDWISNRMNQVDLKDVLKGSFELLDENHYYAKEMRYPKVGGYKSFLQPLIIENKNLIYLNHKVAKIDINLQLVEFENGNKVYYDKLISSIPLTELVNLVTPSNDEMHKLANTLFATSVDLISVGFSRVVTDKLWFYIYDEDIIASRAYAPHVKSVANAPEGFSSLQFEIYSSIKSKQHYSVEEMINNTLYAIEKMGIAQKKDILFAKHKQLKYGNVVFDLGMENRRDKLLQTIRGLGIEPIGRFGRWDYLWSNQAFMSGIDGVNKIL